MAFITSSPPCQRTHKKWETEPKEVAAREESERESVVNMAVAKSQRTTDGFSSKVDQCLNFAQDKIPHSDPHDPTYIADL